MKMAKILILSAAFVSSLWSPPDMDKNGSLFWAKVKHNQTDGVDFL
jgi:hypothetical protein